MSTPTDGGSAFPCNITKPKIGESGFVIGTEIAPEPGMTLRDYFAAKAAAGFLANSGTSCPSGMESEFVVKVAAMAYAFADAMLAGRSKQ